MNDDLPPTILSSGPKITPMPMSPPASGAANYEVGNEIARGGMGAILEAKDGKLDRTVAVKIMHLEAEMAIRA